MIDYDDVQQQIEDLHAEAEELAEMAWVASTEVRRDELLQDAKRLLRKAARLRAQAEVGVIE